MHKVPNFPKQVNMNTPLISLCNTNMNTVNSQFIQIRYYTNKYYTKVYIKNKLWWKCSYISYLHHLSEIQTVCEKVFNIEENTAQQKKHLLYLPHDDKNIPLFMKRISQCHYLLLQLCEFTFSNFITVKAKFIHLWKQNQSSEQQTPEHKPGWKYLLQNLRLVHF